MHGWNKQISAPQIKNIPKKIFRSHVNVLARFFSAPANGIYFAENLPAAPPGVYGASSRFRTNRCEREHKPIYQERALIMLYPTVFVPLKNMQVKMEEFSFAFPILCHLSFANAWTNCIITVNIDDEMRHAGAGAGK